MRNGGADDNEVDYARGGGSSGALLSAGCASITSRAGAFRAGAIAVTTAEATASADGAHGAIVWQPFGAHGNRQGDSCSGCSRGADDERSALCGIDIPAMSARWVAPPIGVTQAYPLSTSTSWSRTNARRKPIGRAMRRMSRRVHAQRCACQSGVHPCDSRRDELAATNDSARTILRRMSRRM